MADSIISPQLFKFLRQLKRHNHRDWFTENKTRYQEEVLFPAVDLVGQLEKPLSKAAPMLEVIPKAHQGSVMRIYRDTRFSKDKTPYKTHVGISIRHQANRDIHAPGVYLHLDPDDCFIGAGCWRPESKVLAAIRAAIDNDPKRWVRVRDHRAFRKEYDFSGEKLKTSPRDYPKDHPLIDDLRRIDFIAISPLQESDFFRDDLVKLLIERIKQAKPLMRFLCDAIDVPY